MTDPWQLVTTTTPAPNPGASVGPVSSPIPAFERAYLGHCIMRPFRRDLKGDIAHIGGASLVAAAIVQILGTRSDTGRTVGELPWNSKFGSGLELLVHANSTVAKEGLAHIYVSEALQRWEPRVIIKQTTVNEEIIDGESHISVDVKFDLASTRTPGSQIIAQDLTVSLYL